MSTALILGASGATGKPLLRNILQSERFAKVISVGRKEIAYDGPNKEKLEQKLVDFENLEQHKEAFVGYDVVFCTLGTTRANAGSAERFVAIDKGYVINSAKLIRAQNPNRPIHYLYCSSGGANANSMILYSRTKGEIEKELGEIGFSRVSIFQPGFLEVNEKRADRGLIHNITLGVAIGAMKLFRMKYYINVETLATAIHRWGIGETKGVTVESKTLENGTQFEILTQNHLYQLAE
ncbi:10416_t:CDS:2 [Ambispora gerdemannii]|uniref:10416_t:CDS:1 n=1 Tax=Ambispora gerdemannii TaxID=144530 RepID=A0A9N9FWA9_9GLOM|nr:10416_t:CDS:2 [Ambispora gerdemannii]